MGHCLAPRGPATRQPSGPEAHGAQGPSDPVSGGAPAAACWMDGDLCSVLSGWKRPQGHLHLPLKGQVIKGSGARGCGEGTLLQVTGPCWSLACAPLVCPALFPAVPERRDHHVRRLTFQSMVTKKGCRLISSTPSRPAPVPDKADTRIRITE